ncbi:MAG: chaperonin GroEL [Chloroflexi bacterium]|nr:chaperonin GroEL [Chloroflexota bacterium]
MRERYVMLAPEAREALVRGVDIMAGLLRPTLGPAARTVAIARIVGSDAPEILDSAATIARRTIQLEYPFEDMGAMIIRQMAWRVFEEAGDGSATAAVLAQALVHEAARYVAAGGNPMLLKRGIDRGLSVALAELRRQARPVDGPIELGRIVAGIVRDPKLEEMMGEVMDSVGPDGAVLVEDAAGIETGHEYIDGVRWNEGYASHFLLKEGETEARLLNPRIFVTDYFLDRADQLVPVVEACLRDGDRSLMVIAPEIKDQALALLILNREKGVLEQAVAVKAPSIGSQRTFILEDIAVITGGRCVHQEAAERFEDVQSYDLGRARQAWATRWAFGILGGMGSKGAIRQRINEAKAELKTIKDDDYTVGKIRERIGKLAGAAAIIRVGAPTKADQAERRLRIEAAVTAGRAALQEGVVAGGGAAFIACIPALERLASELNGDEAVGVRALAGALTAPMRAIAENAGLAPSSIVHLAREKGLPWTFDVVRQAWVDAYANGIADPLPVVLAALEISISAATMALTTDVLIRHKKPSMASNP